MLMKEEIPRFIVIGQSRILKEKLPIVLEILKNDKKLFEKAIASGKLKSEVKNVWERGLVVTNFYLKIFDVPLPSYRLSPVKSQGSLINKRTDQLVFEVSENDADDMEISIEKP